MLLLVVNMLFGCAHINEEVWLNLEYLSYFRKTIYFLLLRSLMKLRSEVKYNEYMFFIINGWLDSQLPNYICFYQGCCILMLP
jgi:hypothetical protein